MRRVMVLKDNRGVESDVSARRHRHQRFGMSRRTPAYGRID